MMEIALANSTDNEFGGIDSHSDVLNRRQKNRERQRRYRAKKRLLADLKTIRDERKPDQPQLEGNMNVVIAQGLTAVHRKRNWKRDARMAHLSQKSVVGTNGSFSYSAALMNKCEVPNLLLQMGTELNIQTKAITQTKRDWKADARKKN